MKQYLWLVCFCLAACGGGGGSGSSDSLPPSGGTGGGGSGGGSSGGSGDVSIDRSLGLVSGGAGLVQGSGVDGVALVGVSGTGLRVGVSGTGLTVGAIQDFSSIVVNDEVLATDNATFTVNGQNATQADLRQGQQVLVIGDIANGMAAGVQYRANMVGVLDSLTVQNLELGLATGQMLAQRIEFDASSVFENTEFELLSAGTSYELSGIVEDDGLLRVTFARQLSGPVAAQLIGPVTELESDEFSIFDLEIDSSSAQLIDFEDNTLEPDDVVAVNIDSYDAQAMTATASQIILLPRLLLSSTAEVEVEGVVDRFVSASDFDVQNQPVTTNAQTQYVGGDSEDLALDERVVVVGLINESGVLVAQEVIFEPDDTVFVAGVVDLVDLQAEEITVSTIVFDLRDLTDFDDFDSIEDLQIGDGVEVVGYLDGDMPIAAEIELEDLDVFEIRGPASSIDVANLTLEVLGILVTTDAVATEFRGFSDETLTATEFFALVDDFDFVDIVWDDGAALSDTPVSVSLEDD